MPIATSDNYSAATGGLIYGGRPAAVPNDVASYIWTPTKDATGKIKGGSWLNLPLNTWCNVSGCALSQISAACLALGFDFSGPKNQGNDKNVTASFNPWCGIALDEVNGKVYSGRGGGHYDGSINGYWSLDLEKMGGGLGWTVESVPSDPFAVGYEWSTQYKARATGTYTAYTPARVDPLAGGNSDILPDNRPTSAHTYGGITWDSLRNRVVTTRQTRWDFDPATKQYTQQFWQTGSAYVPVNSGDMVLYHPGTDRIYGRLNAGVGGQGYNEFSYVQGASPVRNVINIPIQLDLAHAITKIDDNRALIVSDAGTNADNYAILNMATATWERSGRIVTNLLSNPNIDCPALCYVPAWGKSIRRQNMAGVGKWALFDFNTAQDTPYVPAGLEPPFVNLPASKMFYYPRRNCVVYLSTTSDTANSVYVMRVN